MKLEGGRRWTREEAGELFEELSGPFFALGWLLSMDGSVVKHGEGRDLDLVLTPTWTTACPALWILGLLNERWTLVERTWSPLHRTWQVVFRDDEDRLIDLLVWRERDREEKRVAELDFELTEHGWGMGC